MSVMEQIRGSLFSDSFDPFDLTQMAPPESFRSRDYSDAFSAEFDAYEGFGESMRLLGNDLKRGLDLYAKTR